MAIQLKRVYEPAAPTDGVRILVDRLWPRGLSKARARIHLWVKEVAPSTELREWFGEDAERWDEFQEKYTAELDAQTDAVKDLVTQVRTGTVTFVFAAENEEVNNAVALKAYVEAKT